MGFQNLRFLLADNTIDDMEIDNDNVFKELEKLSQSCNLCNELCGSSGKLFTVFCFVDD